MITPAQRLARQKSIGSSDAAPVVLGADDYTDRLGVYASKVLPLPPDSTGDAAEAGNLLEPAIRAMAARELGVAIVEAPDTFVHPTRPYMTANLDGLVADGGLCEIKSIDWRKAKELGEPGTDAVLPKWLVQTQHQLEVTGLPWAHVAAFVSAFDLRMFLVPRDRELGEMIAERERIFWHDNVLARVPPPETDPASALRYAARLARTDDTLALDASTSAYEAMRELRDVKAQQKILKDLEALAKERIASFMGAARKVTCDLGSVSWTKEGKQTNWQAVARELGASAELVKKHTTTTARKFTPRFTADDGDE